MSERRIPAGRRERESKMPTLIRRPILLLLFILFLLIFNLFLLLFMDYIVIFSIIYEFFNTISVVF